MDKMREEFERFAESRGFDPKYYFGCPIHPNYYDHDTVNEMWLSWKASRAALCIKLPDSVAGNESDYMLGVIDALDKEGVSYE